MHTVLQVVCVTLLTFVCSAKFALFVVLNYEILFIIVVLYILDSSKCNIAAIPL